jgi:hypothetical protein
VTQSEELTPEVAAWAESCGFSHPERVSGGRNNRIFKLRGQRGLAALKVYYRGSEDRRDRFAAEHAFYKIAAKRGVSAPPLLDCDQRLGISLLGWIEGTPIGKTINEEEIGAAARFLVETNEPALADAEIPFEASEACFSSADHLDLLQRRISKLGNATSERSALAEFVRATLSPFAGQVRKALHADDRSEFHSTGWRRVLSPGDFGLHNAMRDENGRIVFFDFEYSGWDDPVKTVADVFLQPEKPVDWKFLPGFCAQLHAWPDLEERVRLWLPFFAAKWAVILLGPAVKDAAERRRFAGEETDDAMIERQIGKARIVIERGNEFLG